MASRYAIWIGYEISQADFKELVGSIPSSTEYLESSRKPGKPVIDLFHYLRSWNLWRMGLHPNLQKHVPRMLLRYHEEKDTDPSSYDCCISHVLFPIRYVPFKHESQLSPDHPGYESLMTPTEREKKFFAILAKLVAKSGGTMDLSKLEWSLMKDLHPSRGRVTI